MTRRVFQRAPVNEAKDLLMNAGICTLAFAAALLLAGCGGYVEDKNVNVGGPARGGEAALSNEARPPAAGPVDGGRGEKGFLKGLERGVGGAVRSAGDPDCGGLPTGDPACGGAEVAAEEKDYMYPEGWNEDEMYKQSVRGPEDYGVDYSGELEDEKYLETAGEGVDEDPEMYVPPTAEQDCEYLAPGDPDYCTKCGGC